MYNKRTVFWDLELRVQPGRILVPEEKNVGWVLGTPAGRLSSLQCAGLAVLEEKGRVV